MTVADGGLKVLLAKRAEAPYAGKWALPGGIVRIDLDHSLDAAAARVVQERLGTHLGQLDQLCAVGGAKRDPRAAWGLSIVYRALLPFDKIQANAGKRIEALHWQSVDEACVDKALAFDHAKLINIAVAKTRQQVNAIELLQGLLPEQFSLGELQTSCEHILGHRLDKSSFRRKLTDRKAVQAIEGAIRRGVNRPAQLYRLSNARHLL